MPIEKRWVVRPVGEADAVSRLATHLRMSPVLTNLLVQRGIDTVEKANKFFNPQLCDLHDPFLMQDMAKAVNECGFTLQAAPVLFLIHRATIPVWY